jgi:cell division protein ZapA (FtsZ GTPase activity inhibitor)
MSLRGVLSAFFGNAGKSVQLQAEIREGIANQADLFNQRLRELIEQQANRSVRDERLLREILDGVANFFSNASKSVQLQAEIREGIANQADLFDQRLRELIEQQANQSVRDEQLLREILDGVANQTNVLNQRLSELIEQQVNADTRRELLLLELWSRRFESATGTLPSIDRSIAPLRPLPIPQISLRRPNPVADLMVTPEFKTYLDFFRTSPSVRRSRLTAESHAILYALIRKIQPAQALAVFRDGTAVCETIARGLCDAGAGRIHLFDDLDHRKTRAILDLWPFVLRKCCSLETGAPAATTSKCSFALIGGDDAEATLAVLADSLGTLVEPGGLLVVTNVSRDGLRKLMLHRTEWRELGVQPEDENQTNFELRLVVYLR